MLPILEEFSKDMEGKVNVWKVNVDENPDIATEYFIRSIPTLLIFKDGKQVWDPLIGVQKKEDLIEKCSQYL
jgi:thioredoxin 1